MGAGKLPEQITDRIEAGRRAMLEDQTPDPLIEKLKSMPVERKIEPEEKSVRRVLSSGAIKGTRTIRKKLAQGWKPRRKRKR